MAATFDTFCFPPQVSEFILYNGPPKSKPATQYNNHNGRSSGSNKWPDIDEILETALESKAALEDKESITPTMRMAKFCSLLYSDNDRSDCGGGIPTLMELQSHQSSHESSLGALSVKEMDVSLDYLLKDGSLENLVIIDNNPADTSSGDGEAEAELDGGQREHQPESLGYITDGQGHSFEKQDLSLAVTQHLASLEDEGSINQDLGESSSYHLSTPGQPLLTRQKWKRSNSDTSTVQISDLTSDQSLEDSHLAKRQRSLSPLGNDLVPDCTPTSKSTPIHAYNGTHPQTGNSNDENATDEEGDDTSVPTCNGSKVSNRERGGDQEGHDDHNGHDHTGGNNTLLDPVAGPASSSRPPSSFRHTSEEQLRRVDGLGEDDNGNGEDNEDDEDKVSDDNNPACVPLGTAATVQQPESTASHPPEDEILESGFPRNDLENYTNIESQRLSRAKSIQQRKSPSSNPTGISSPTGIPTKPAKQRRFFRKAESRRDSPIGRSHGTARMAGSDADGASKARSDNNDIGRPSQQPTRHKLTDITLRPVSSGVSFFAAIIQADRNMPIFSCSELVMLVESALGHAGKIDNITTKPLGPESWLLTGFRHSLRDMSGPPVSRTTMQPSGIYSSDVRSQERTLHSRAANVAAVDLEDDPRSSDEDDSASDCDLDLGGGGGCPSEDGTRSSARIHTQWSELDKQRLLAYKKEDKSWEWIFGQFPNRTHGAVQTRWHMLR